MNTSLFSSRAGANCGKQKGLLLATMLGAVSLTFDSGAQQTGTNILSTANLAGQNYGNDAPWYTANIPFFDCSDATIQQVYYYRWALWKSHLKDLGNQGYISTEFLGDVGWALYPFQSLNDATAYHMHEGRWVKNPRYVNDYINYMYADGGNDRHFSEAIADAAYANFLARGDLSFTVQYLPRHAAGLQRLGGPLRCLQGRVLG